ncbi:envelope stress response protein PspG [Candidatus Symbiopectobacterium sp. 'North America']|uniref:envelope stress response protein PspG n=1 Tax=Candidatus Symbiopectobacterium sp. 'North America' TaxID=2794574 RepID=UPI0018CB3A66|nr:envelope stress response protein PspG [Candidatus Symbiopectobacterium sp. 'North America']MBG6246623.1 envelope stress response protein PspG [Candidatus Symbiopectobacterium sp. 'North America']
MLEFLFVVGFFVMLMVTGISLIGVLGVLVIAAVVMLEGGLIVTAIKVLPWLLLAMAIVWLWRYWQQKPLRDYR